MGWCGIVCLRKPDSKFLPSIQVRRGFALKILKEDLFIFYLLIRRKTGKATHPQLPQHWLPVLQIHCAQSSFLRHYLLSLPEQALVTLLCSQGPREPKLGVISGHKYFTGNSQCPGTCSLPWTYFLVVWGPLRTVLVLKTHLCICFWVSAITFRYSMTEVLGAAWSLQYCQRKKFPCSDVSSEIIIPTEIGGIFKIVIFSNRILIFSWACTCTRAHTHTHTHTHTEFRGWNYLGMLI